MKAPPSGADERTERFRGLFEEHYSPVLAYALRRSRNEADAHDVVAETFTVAWRRFEDLPPEDRWLPWLYGVARRVLANQRRSMSRQDRLAVRVASEQRIGRQGGEEQGRASVIHEQLGKLRPDDQEILRLAAWEELSHDEIAAVLGISVNAVGIRLHRARNRLGKRLETAGYGAKDSDGGRTQTQVKGKDDSDRGKEAI